MTDIFCHNCMIPLRSRLRRSIGFLGKTCDALGFHQSLNCGGHGGPAQETELLLKHCSPPSHLCGQKGGPHPSCWNLRDQMDCLRRWMDPPPIHMLCHQDDEPAGKLCHGHTRDWLAPHAQLLFWNAGRWSLFPGWGDVPYPLPSFNLKSLSFKTNFRSSGHQITVHPFLVILQVLEWKGIWEGPRGHWWSVHTYQPPGFGISSVNERIISQT